jgi:hypothetical protein
MDDGMRDFITRVLQERKRAGGPELSRSDLAMLLMGLRAAAFLMLRRLPAIASGADAARQLQDDFEALRAAWGYVFDQPAMDGLARELADEIVELCKIPKVAHKPEDNN